MGEVESVDRLEDVREKMLRIEPHISEHYSSFRIAKKVGFRTISAPSPELLSLQREVLEVLRDFEPNTVAKAYRRGLSIVDNARYHVRRDCVLKIDIENFFDSVGVGLISECLIRNGLNAEDAELVSRICSFGGFLPQGAPTSGHISNLVMQKFDRLTMIYCLKNDLRYTRYSDDITISGHRSECARAKDHVYELLRLSGFTPNTKKTRMLIRGRHRQRITGVICNTKMTIGRVFLRDIRQEMHYVIKFGFRAHSKARKYKDELDCIRSLLGKVSHALHVSGARRELCDWKAFLIGAQDYYSSRKRSDW